MNLVLRAHNGAHVLAHISAPMYDDSTYQPLCDATHITLMIA